MYLTEYDAGMKACCNPAGGGALINPLCVASKCMAWRWDSIYEKTNENTVRVKALKGFCGLAGTPLPMWVQPEECNA